MNETICDLDYTGEAVFTCNTVNMAALKEGLRLSKG